MGEYAILKMKFVVILFTFCVLSNCSQSLHEHSPSFSQLTISIHQNFPEDAELIPLLQEIISNASKLFHHVTNGFILVENVTIIVPNIWTLPVLEASSDVHSLSDIRLEVHSSFPGHPNIHTTQYGECGQPGKYMTATKHFFNYKDSTVSKSDISLKFFQQIIRYKFGIFENVNPSHENATRIEKLQEINCLGKTGWQVIKETLHNKHSGYKSSKIFKAPQFKIFKTEPASAYIFLMDVSENLWNKSKAWTPQSIMQHIFKHLAEDFLPIPSHLGFLTYSDQASVLRNMTLIGTKSDWKHFFQDLHIEKNGTHQNLDIGIHACLKVLESQGISKLGTRIVLLTDVGWDNPHSKLFENVTKEVLSKGLIFHSLVLGHDTHHHQDKLDKLSKAMGGQFTLISDKKHTLEYLPAKLAALAPQEVILVTQEEVHIPRSLLPFKKDFYIDSGLQGRAQVVLDRKSSQLSSGSFQLLGPHWTKSVDPHRTVYEANQTGLWSMQISELDSVETLTENVSFSFHVKAKKVRKTEQAIHLSSWLERHKIPNVLCAFAQLTSPRKLQNISLTFEVLDHAGNILILTLLDSGLGADAIADDGIYSGYFTQFEIKGYYQFFVRTSGSQITEKTGMENEAFNRYTYAGAIRHKLEVNSSDRIPPARVKDLRILNNTNQGDKITVMWTAVGDNMDYGKVAAYELRVREFNKSDIRSTFSEWHRILPKNGSLLPLQSGSLQNITFSLPSKLSKHKPKSIQIALRSHDHNNNPSEISNVVNYRLNKSVEIELKKISRENKDNSKFTNEDISSTKSYDSLSGKANNNVTEPNPLNSTTPATHFNTESRPLIQSEIRNASNQSTNERNQTIFTTTNSVPHFITENSTLTPNETLPLVLENKPTMISQYNASSSPTIQIPSFEVEKQSTSIPVSVQGILFKKQKYEVDNIEKTEQIVSVTTENISELYINTTLTFEVSLEQEENTSTFLMAPGILEDIEKRNEKVRFAHINLRVSTVVAAWVGGFATTFFVMVIVAAVVKNRQKTNNYNIRKSEEDFMEAMALKEDSF